MTIRWMTLEDIDQVLEIEALSFKTPWLRASFENELLMNNLARYMVCIVDDDGTSHRDGTIASHRNGTIAGYIGCWHIVDEGHITNIAVHPNFRRHGIGKALIEELMGYARSQKIESLTLEVRVTNEPAIKLYQHYGFKSAGVRPKYYQDTNEDALIMWAHLGDETLENPSD